MIHRLGYVVAVIPARLESTRLPRKPLLEIAGVPMIVRVVDQVLQAPSVDSIVVATDSKEVVDVVNSSGRRAETILTSSECENGTERVVQAMRCFAGPVPSVVVNVQGDEPRVNPRHIDAVVELLTDRAADVGTLAVPEHQEDVLNDPNTVKCVMDETGFALYFSRAKIPCLDHPVSSVGHIFHRHVVRETLWRKTGGKTLLKQWSSYFCRTQGLYAFRYDFIQHRLPTMSPCSLERSERLEQLRWMYHGARIKVHVTSFAHRGVDTPSDLERMRQELERI